MGLEDYAHGMALDENGKVIPKVSASLSGSTIQQPVDIQSRLSQTIQTHNAVSIGTSVWSPGSWVDTNGFSDLGVSLLNDAATGNKAIVQWSNDGTNQHGEETVYSSASARYRATSIPTKARYARITINNEDAATHVFSVWFYLKA